AADRHVDRVVGTDRDALRFVHVVARFARVRQAFDEDGAGTDRAVGVPHVAVDLVRLRHVEVLDASDVVERKALWRGQAGDQRFLGGGAASGRGRQGNDLAA